MESIVRRLVLVRLLALAFLLVALSCTRSKMLNKWVDPDYPSDPFRNVLVLALFEGQTTRAYWEEALANELEEFDVRASPAYELLLDSMPDSAAVFDAARSAGYDGVVVIYESYTDTTDAEYFEGYFERIAVDGRWVLSRPTPPPPLPGVSRPSHYVYIYHPPYAVYSMTVNWDVEVWTAPDDVRMVWAGTTAVINPKSQPPAREIVAGWIGYELAASGLVRTGD